MTPVHCTFSTCSSHQLLKPVVPTLTLCERAVVSLTAPRGLWLPGSLGNNCEHCVGLQGVDGRGQLSGFQHIKHCAFLPPPHAPKPYTKPCFILPGCNLKLVLRFLKRLEPVKVFPLWPTYPCLVWAAVAPAGSIQPVDLTRSPGAEALNISYGNATI